MMREAEIYLDAKQFLHLLVSTKQDIVVGRHRFPFGKLLLDFQTGPIHVPDGDREDPLDERIPAFPIDDDQQDAFS